MTDDAMPILNQLNLVESDMDASIEFYRRLGLDVPEGGAHDGIRHVEIPMAGGAQLDLDNEALAQVYNAEWRRPEGGQRVVVGFSLPSRVGVDDKYREHGRRSRARPRTVSTTWRGRGNNIWCDWS